MTQREYEKLAEKEIPIYTDLKPGPNGEIDCMQKILRKKYLRFILIGKLKQLHANAKEGI